MTHTNESPNGKSDKNKGNFGTFVAGFLIGSIASATFSLLNAPQSGKETREQIMSKGMELRDRADEEIQRFRVQAEGTLGNLREQVDGVQARLTGQAEDIQSRVSGAVREGKKGARAVGEELADSKTDTTQTKAS